MDTKEKDSCLREAKILEILQHKHIVGYHDVFKTRSGKLCIVMEYCEKGDLDKEIKKQANQLAKTNDPACYFSDEQVLTWFVQMCLALKKVHSFDFIHRDIKAANIFLDNNMNVKLADFGIVRVLSNDKSRATTKIGTPAYMAPEIFDDQSTYGLPVDMWSMGIILYQLHTLELPFKSSQMSKVIK